MLPVAIRLAIECRNKSAPALDAYIITTQSARLVANVADAIDRASVVVGNQDRTVWQICNVNWTTSCALAYWIQEAVSKHFSFASVTVSTDRYVVDQVAAWLGAVPGTVGSDKQTALVFLRKCLAGVLCQTQLSLVSRKFDLWEHSACWLFHVFQFRSCWRAGNFELAVPIWEAKMLTSFGQLVEFAWWNVIAQTVNLVVGGPDGFAICSHFDTSWVTHAHCVHLAAGTIEWVHANNCVDTDRVVQGDLVLRLNVERPAQGDVQLAIASNAANTAGVVE